MLSPSLHRVGERELISSALTRLDRIKEESRMGIQHLSRRVNSSVNREELLKASARSRQNANNA